MSSIIYDKILDICKRFGIVGELISCCQINDGIINTTYRALFELNGSKNSYVIQKINSYVFKNPYQIMSNISLVTNHIANKSPQKTHVSYYLTDKGVNFYRDNKGDYWRICNCIDSVTYNTCDNLTVLQNAGSAFGSFQKQLCDFDAGKLYETISDFHNTKKRIDVFFKDVDEDVCKRAESVKKEIYFIESVKEKASQLSNMLENNELPLRVTHNDTKINNVLFDVNTGEPLAVIDLDTVMPGLAAYDFGDAVRSSANEVSEDETDYSRIKFNLEKFEAFSKGFIGETKDILTQKEIETMALGAFTMATELAVRFLDDYITGDKYFQIKYPTHNLIRAGGQITLAKDILSKLDKMNEIILNIGSK